MAAYVAGDRSAFNELFARYSTLVTRVAARGLYDQSAVPDLVQRTFLQLHRARNDFKPGSPLRPWLMTIAMNVKRQHLRSVGRRREDALELDGRTDPVAAPHDAAQTQRARKLHQALASLPETTREVIELHWLEGLSFAEVATVVGASLSAVKVRAHRGYSKLRAQLVSQGVTVAEFEG
ncbi:MAG: RNA polymerase sigma factor (sigma-70 family) [Myxococcota bacterium]|jgi:RNA polymerase sigma factor (sigma-70 family)